MVEKNKNAERITYMASISDVDFITAEGKKSIKIKGVLMNSDVNTNGWQVKVEDMKNLASQVSGKPVKVQHSPSDWEIIGEGVSGTYDPSSNSIHYEALITDPKAVEKFESGTWNNKNIGISPGVGYAALTCSICKKNAKSCGHIPMRNYDGIIAGVITEKPYLEEMSTTSRPAYKYVGAGTVDFIDVNTLVASIRENVDAEGKIMGEERVKELETLLAQEEVKGKDMKKKMDEVSASMEEMSKHMKEMASKMEAEKVEVSKKDEIAKAERDTLMAKIKEEEGVISQLKTQTRTAELKTIIQDEMLIAEVLKGVTTDEQFTAEVSKIKKLMATRVTGSSGSAPIDGSGAPADLVKAEFGATADEMAKKIFG